LGFLIYLALAVSVVAAGQALGVALGASGDICRRLGSGRRIVSLAHSIGVHPVAAHALFTLGTIGVVTAVLICFQISNFINHFLIFAYLALSSLGVALARVSVALAGFALAQVDAFVGPGVADGAVLTREASVALGARALLDGVRPRLAGVAILGNVHAHAYQTEKQNRNPRSDMCVN
jgi:hypothetical protein